MNIKFVITRSLIFFILVIAMIATFVTVSTILATFFASSVGANKYIVWLITAVLIVIGMTPLKNWLAQITDSIFFKGKIDYEALLKELTIKLAEELDLRKILSNTQNLLISGLKVKSVTLLLSAGDDYFLPPEEISDTPINERTKNIRGNYFPALLSFLKKEPEIIVVDELERRREDLTSEHEIKKFNKIFSDIEKLHVAVIVPILKEKNISALLLMGAKTSGDIFSNDDIKLLEVLSPQLSSSLYKASLFQEAQLFNYKLQKEVAMATADLKSVNQKLAHANGHLKDLDRAKSEFMSITSHQLRTPLTGIMGYLSMILEGDFGSVDKKKKPILVEIFQAAQRLIRMVNIFLNISRIEAGRLSFNFVEDNIVEIIQKQIYELQPNADKKGLYIKLINPPEPIPLIMTDRDKIRDVILNLLDNAIKYTEKGGIIIHVISKNSKEIEIIIKDTGFGIEPNDANKLFDKFIRGHGMIRINPDGSGLGLFIAKRMVEGHHGKIWVSSAGLNQGSEFHVLLPVKQQNI